MLRSMTGFGRGEFTKEDKKIIVEIKSVNHRYLDTNIRLPRKLNFLENYVRNLVKSSLSRGKVDVFINYEDHSEERTSIEYNDTLAKEYYSYFQKISEEFAINNDICVSHLTRYPDVLKLVEQEDENDSLLKEIVKGAMDQAISKMVETREKEGQLLKTDLLEKLDNLYKGVQTIKKYSPDIVQSYKEKLEARIKELVELPDLDESRLALEVAVFADKACIDEEIVRLESHITHMKDALNSEKPIGRKLDFLAQEMNRESNTILSKANAVQISSVGLELKTEVEKIREQIQNIE